MTRRGFTLVEVLVSLALLSAVITLSLSILGQANRLDVILQDITSERDVGDHVSALIRRDMKGLIQPEGTSGSLMVREDDKGRLVLHFTTTGRLSADDEGIVAPFNEASYALKTHPGNLSLNMLYRRHDWFVDDDMSMGGNWELVSDRVVTLEFEFASEETEATRAWPDGQFPETVTFYLKVLPPDVAIEELPLDPDSWETRLIKETLSLK